MLNVALNDNSRGEGWWGGGGGGGGGGGKENKKRKKERKGKREERRNDNASWHKRGQTLMLFAKTFDEL